MAHESAVGALKLVNDEAFLLVQALQHFALFTKLGSAELLVPSGYFAWVPTHFVITSTSFDCSSIIFCAIFLACSSLPCSS